MAETKLKTQAHDSGITLTSPILSGAGGTTAGQHGFDTTDHAILIGDGTNNAIIHVFHWKAWTPAWTNLTTTNGTNTGLYCKIGKTVHLRTYFQWQTGCSVGTAPTMTLPVTIGSAGLTPIGRVSFYDANTGVVYLGYIDGFGACRVEKVDGTYNTLANATSSIPMTWTTDDAMYVHATYESA